MGAGPASLRRLDIPPLPCMSISPDCRFPIDDWSARLQMSAVSPETKLLRSRFDTRTLPPKLAQPAWNEAIGLYTGDIDMVPPASWNRAAGMFVKQFDPLPMSILSIMPEVTLGR